jgi:hypothetical protein
MPVGRILFLLEIAAVAARRCPPPQPDLPKPFGYKVAWLALRTVMRLAAVWSIDPTTLDQQFDVPGLVVLGTLATSEQP